jgi:hypothetical protein
VIVRATLLAITLAAAIGAAATAAQRPTVAGAWAFKTEPYPDRCVMTGELVVQPQRSKAGYVCKLTAYETCAAVKNTAKQSCVLSESNGAVTITSTLISTTYPDYLPDNFTLKLESAARMSGQLRSADTAPVIFYRGAGAIS